MCKRVLRPRLAQDLIRKLKQLFCGCWGATDQKTGIRGEVAPANTNAARFRRAFRSCTFRTHGERSRRSFRLSTRSVTLSTSKSEAIVDLDFFTMPTATLRVLYCLFMIEHGRRRILHCNLTRHSSATGWCSSCERPFLDESEVSF